MVNTGKLSRDFQVYVDDVKPKYKEYVCVKICLNCETVVDEIKEVQESILIEQLKLHTKIKRAQEILAKHRGVVPLKYDEKKVETETIDPYEND
jgi:hypothetical protein